MQRLSTNSILHYLIKIPTHPNILPMSLMNTMTKLKSKLIILLLMSLSLILKFKEKFGKLSTTLTDLTREEFLGSIQI